MLFFVLALAAALNLPLETVDVLVVDTHGKPLGAAGVRLDGPLRAAGRTGANGIVEFTRLPSGDYTFTAAHAGYRETAQEVDLGNRPATIRLVLAPETMSTLHEIARVSTGSVLPLNAGTATTNVIPGAQLMVVDPRQLVQSLDDIPGVVSTTNAATGANRASAGSAMTTQIRGALPYETQSLIDGHPVSVGADGTFSPLLVKPAFLESVEVAKGPGAMSLEQSASIGGTVNYRTLEPTTQPRADGWFGVDGWGGTFASVRATGTSGRFGYAFAVTNDGTSGPLRDYAVAGSALPLLYASPAYTVNGRPIVGLPIGLAADTSNPQFQGAPGSVRYAEPVYVCCGQIGTGYDSRGTLLKVEYAPDARSALTLSFLSAQGDTDLSGARAENETPLVNYSIFAPPAGYTGSLAAGTPISFDSNTNVGLHQNDRQQLLEGAYRTWFGPYSFQARAYDSRASSFLYNTAGSSAFSFGGQTWGGLYTCAPGSQVVGASCVNGGVSSAPVLTTFDGTPAVFAAAGHGTQALTSDFVHGISLQAERMIGAATVDAGVDRSMHESRQYVDSAAIPLQGYSLAPGSAQLTTTLFARAEVPFAGTRGRLAFSNYVLQYSSHYSGNGGTTWSDATHAVDTPRLGILWDADRNTSLHASAGYSVAPPYINLLSSHGSLPIANTNGNATAYLQNANNGEIRPEVGLGYEAGITHRFASRFVAGLSGYLTDLHDLFLTSTQQQGTYTPPSGPNAGNTEPLYITKTANLGHARYEGVEFDAKYAPLTGFGFEISGALQRAYPYGLPPGFYDTAAGRNTTNLGVIPYVNFQPDGPGYNGLSGRIPYSDGYAALTWQRLDRVSARLGVNYVGPNNPYNRPAFAILSAGASLQVGSGTSLELSAWNIADVYSESWEDVYSGVPVPLVNGKLGAIDGGNVGPPTVTLTLHRSIR